MTKLKKIKPSVDAIEFACEAITRSLTSKTTIYDTAVEILTGAYGIDFADLQELREFKRRHEEWANGLPRVHQFFADEAAKQSEGKH